MIRKLLVVVAVLSLGATAVAAQSCQDVIDKRQALMKRSAELAKSGSAMIKGDAPFDLAKTKEIFAAFAEDAAALPTLFPDCSKTGDSIPRPGRRSGTRIRRLQGGDRQVCRRRESGAGQHQGPRQPEGRFPNRRQGLRVLPSGVPGQDELNFLDC